MLILLSALFAGAVFDLVGSSAKFFDDGFKSKCHSGETFEVNLVRCVGRAVIVRITERLMLKPEARISPEFWQLHQWSKYINFIDLTFILVAAMLSVAEPRRDVNAPR